MFDKLFSKSSFSDLDEEQRRLLGDYIRANMELRELLNKVDARKLELLANPDAAEEESLRGFIELTVAEKLREVAEKEAQVIRRSQNVGDVMDELKEFATAAMTGAQVIVERAFSPGLLQHVMETKMPEFNLLSEHLGGAGFGKFFGQAGPDDAEEDDGPAKH